MRLPSVVPLKTTRGRMQGSITMTDNEIVRQLVTRLSRTGRVYTPQATHRSVEQTLVHWLGQTAGIGSERWDGLHKDPGAVEDHGLPPTSWARRDVELRRPIERALGVAALGGDTDTASRTVGVVRRRSRVVIGLMRLVAITVSRSGQCSEHGRIRRRMVFWRFY